MISSAKLILTAAFFTVLATGPAYAYLDPGTGSIVLQGLIAAVAGGLVAARLYWDKVKRYLSFGKRKDEGAETNLRP